MSCINRNIWVNPQKFNRQHFMHFLKIYSLWVLHLTPQKKIFHLFSLLLAFITKVLKVCYFLIFTAAWSYFILSVFPVQMM